MKNERPGMEIYVHIPYCVKKCRYCDFLSFPCGDPSGGKEERYVEALLCEIARMRHGRGKRDAAPSDVTSVFIGGGTPSVLPAEAIRRILDRIREVYFVREDAEITMEANPGTVTEEKARIWRAAGVNRLSMGLQSAHDGELRLLGRIHTWADFLESWETARNAGFDNINIDLMSALPGQSAETWRDTLKRVIALAPEHISAYSLIVEPGTPFYEEYGGMSSDIAEYGEYADVPEAHLARYRGRARIPGETEDRAMYHDTKRILAEAGYRRYEISNYAKAGRECRHNLGYWTGTEYLGFGLGASSYLCENGQYVRFSVTRDLEEYRDRLAACSRAGTSVGTDTGDAGITRNEGEAAKSRLMEDSYRDEENPDQRNGALYDTPEVLTEADRMAEFMFLGLRLTDGVSAEEFRKEFGRELRDVYGKVIDKLKREGLLAEAGDRVLLTETGLDVSNAAMAEFLPD